MRRLAGFSILIVFIAAISIIVLGICILSTHKIPDISENTIVKEFQFLSEQTLKEWQEKLLIGNPTKYSIVDYAGERCVKAESHDSASALFYKIRLLHYKNPFISWVWKAEEFPLREREETLDSKKEFDFAAQVYVIFYAKFLLNSKAIQYVWAKSLPKGTSGDNPYTKKVKVLVLESGPGEGWKREERDIVKDFELLFGEKLEKDVTAIAFMTDSDSTSTSASCYFSDISIGYLKKEMPFSRAKVPWWRGLSREETL